MTQGSRAQTTDRYRTEVITDRAAFLTLGAPWQSLNARAGGNIFADFGWISSWADVYWTDAVNAFIALVWQGDDLVAALPLRVEQAKISKKLPFRTATYRMLYDDRVGSHHILIAKGHEAAAQLLFEMCAAGPARYLDLTPIEPSPALDAFRAAAQPRWTMERVEILSAYADVSKGWDDYCAKRSANARKNMRATKRKLENQEVEVVASRTPDAVGLSVLEEVFTVSQRSWKAINGTDIGTKDEDRAFFKNLFETLAPQGKMQIYVTRLDGKPVCNSVTLQLGDEGFGLVSDYDEAYAASRVGRFTMMAEIQQSCADGVRTVNFLRETPFTKTFSDYSGDLMRLRIAVRPSIARWIVSAEFGLRRIVERIWGDKDRKTGRRKIIGDRVPTTNE